MALIDMEHGVRTDSRRSGFLMAVPDSGKQHRSTTVIVTGRHELLPDVVIAIKDAGLDVLAAEVAPGDISTDIPPASVGCYVQLPPALEAGDASPFGRARSTVAENLRQRFDALARVAPMLAPSGTVLLVADPDSAVSGALALLAEAVEGDHQGTKALVLEPSHSAAEIAARARHETADPLPWNALLKVGPELAHTDWRDEVLGLGA